VECGRHGTGREKLARVEGQINCSCAFPQTQLAVMVSWAFFGGLRIPGFPAGRSTTTTDNNQSPLTLHYLHLSSMTQRLDPFCTNNIPCIVLCCTYYFICIFSSFRHVYRFHFILLVHCYLPTFHLIVMTLSCNHHDHHIMDSIHFIPFLSSPYPGRHLRSLSFV